MAGKVCHGSYGTWKPCQNKGAKWTSNLHGMAMQLSTVARFYQCCNPASIRTQWKNILALVERFAPAAAETGGLENSWCKLMSKVPKNQLVSATKFLSRIIGAFCILLHLIHWEWHHRSMETGYYGHSKPVVGVIPKARTFGPPHAAETGEATDGMVRPQMMPKQRMDRDFDTDFVDFVLWEPFSLAGAPYLFLDLFSSSLPSFQLWGRRLTNLLPKLCDHGMKHERDSCSCFSPLT